MIMELPSKKDKYLQWFAQEIELNQKHEELLAKREMLLATTSSVYKTKEKQQHSRKVNLLKAKSRNDQLVEEVKNTHQSLKDKLNNSTGASFIALRGSYFQEADKEWRVNHK